jgi:hypothetical protein
MTNSLSIVFNGCQRNIPIGLIPVVDDPMRSLLSSLHRGSPPPASMATLSEKAKDLSNTKNLLASAKMSSIRDKLLGALPTAVLTGLVSGTVLGFCINPLIGMAVLILTLLYHLACHIAATFVGQMDKRQEFDSPLSMYPAGVIASPFILSYLLVTRSSSLESAANASQNEVQSQASETLRYWSKNGKPLLKEIDGSESRLDQALSSMQTLPVRSPRGENDLAACKDLHVRTRTEIAKGLEMTKLYS